MQALLDTLRQLEIELHHGGQACPPARVEQLLHPDFHEVGRSGLQYDRATVLRYLSTQTQPLRADARDFAVFPLGPDRALLTYHSTHYDADGHVSGQARRSSIWLHTDAGWQLFYHQGTPSPDET